MSWTAEAKRRAVAYVFTGQRDFALILQDGTECADPNYRRIRGEMSEPFVVEGRWGATNPLVEFHPFGRTVGAQVVAVAVYDGAERLGLAPLPGAVLVAERVQPVLRPGDLWFGLAE